eukprot:9735168-Prorocentrum_lima.AAC.1
MQRALGRPHVREVQLAEQRSQLGACVGCPRPGSRTSGWYLHISSPLMSWLRLPRHPLLHR